MNSVLTSLSPKQIKLMILVETRRGRKVRRILSYHVSNKLLSTESFAQPILLLFYRFRDEKELLSDFPKCIKRNCKKKEFKML